MHKLTREGDEHVCSCGRRWGIDEPDPHMVIGIDPAKPGSERTVYAHRVSGSIIIDKVIKHPAGLTNRVGLGKKYIDEMREALRKT